MKKPWKKTKPTEPGAYYVRGFNNFGEGKQYEALVEVRKKGRTLICNLHEENSRPPDEPLTNWAELERYSDRFQWCGPLLLPNNQVERQP